MRCSRRAVLGAAGAAVGGSLLPGTVPARAQSADPAQFQYGPGHAGYRSGSVPADGVSTDWSFSTFAGLDQDTAPVAADGTVYLGATDGNVYAIDAASGDRRWAFDAGGEVRSTPAVVSGQVCVGGPNGTFLAIDAASGEQAWTFGFPEGKGSLNMRTTYVDKRIFLPGVFAIGAGADDAGGLWRSDGGGGLGVAYADGTVFAPDPDSNRVFAFGARDGSPRWRKRIGARNAYHAVPTVAGGQLYLVAVGRGGRTVLFALDAATGALQWKAPIGTQENAFSSPAVHEGTVVVGRAPTGAEEGSISNTEGEVVAFDTGTGEERWRATTAGGVIDSPSIVGDTVVVGSHGEDAGRLYALSLADGTPRWTQEFRDDVVGHTVGADGIYVTTQGGSVIGLSAAGGGGTTTTAPGNEPPDAGFSISEGEPAVGQEVTFDAAESTDPDGNIARYEWDLTYDGSGTPTFEEAGRVVRATYDDPGPVGQVLRVTDDDGATDVARGEVVVRDDGETPTSEVSPGDPTTETGTPDSGSGRRQRGFFTNDGGDSGALSNVFNLTVLGFLLSVAGIIHQMIRGR